MTYAIDPLKLAQDLRLLAPGLVDEETSLLRSAADLCEMLYRRALTTGELAPGFPTHLMPHQRKYLDGFSAPGAAVYHAPTQMGKTALGKELLREYVQRSPKSKAAHTVHSQCVAVLKEQLVQETTPGGSGHQWFGTDKAMKAGTEFHQEYMREPYVSDESTSVAEYMEKRMRRTPFAPPITLDDLREASEKYPEPPAPTPRSAAIDAGGTPFDAADDAPPFVR